MMLLPSRHVIVAALVVFIAAPAAADPYQSKKDDREGLIFGLAVGPAVVKGLGELKDIGGLGAGFSFRFGTVASPKLLWLVQLDSASYLIEDELTDVKVNQSYSVTVGGQYYVREALWARAGVGFGGFVRRAQQRGGVAEESFSGLGFTSGVGVDLWLRRKWVLNFEVVFSAAFVDAAFISHGGLMLAVTRY